MSLTVSQWYEGKRIFITGATGFMGKVLVEKLLRSCNVEMIYVLIRPKRGQSPEERLKAFFSIPLFDELKIRSGSSIFSKVCYITGDVTETNLGINDQELNYLKENIDVVFHMAANVKFREPLKKAVLMNLGGSYNMLEMAKGFKKLSAYIHVSTSYCHVNEKILEEKMYPAPHNPRKILELMQWLDDDAVESITPHLIKSYPNTYAYTKCLTEDLVGQYTSHMRIAILRPSMVTASYMEPIPGWVDNLNGPTGLMVGIGKGLIRSMLGNSSHIADLVPVDITINGVIVVAKELSDEERSMKEPLVVNLTSNSSNAITWGETLDICRKHTLNNPYSIMLWYPNGKLRTSLFWHTLIVVFFHYLPAYLVDFFFKMSGLKPLIVRTQNKISKGLDVLFYYNTKVWHFEHKKIYDMYGKLSNDDKNVFNCDMREIDWDDYLLNYILGIRKYVMHEDPANVQQARSFIFWLYILDIAAKIGFIGFFISIMFYYVMPYLKCHY